MNVTTVIFDAGLTLVRPEPSFAGVFARACAAAGVTVDADDIAAASHLWAEHHDAWRARGEPSPWEGDDAAESRYWRGLYRRYLGHLRIEHDEGLPWQVFDAFIDHRSYGTYPDVAEALDDLDRRGVRLGLLSNWGSRPALREVLSHSGLADRFDAVVVSGEERVAKPDPAVFHLVLQRLGERPGPHVAYVGDDLRHDIDPAGAVGLTAVLVDRQARRRDHDGPRVTDLRQLPSVIPLARRERLG
ncbi:MAG: HAD family hydrolase [Actinomycetota bacterium]|nr:HAD family hydrolase [Actinomycetota bacterium]